MMIAVLAAALASRQSKGNSNNEAIADDGELLVVGNDSTAIAIYEGVLPTENGQGVQYILSVDSIGPGGECGYTLVTTYLDANGQAGSNSSISKGKKEVVQKNVNNQSKTAYKLTPDDGTSPLYFVVVNDTTLRLANDSLLETVSDVGYDIVQVKQ